MPRRRRPRRRQRPEKAEKAEKPARAKAAADTADDEAGPVEAVAASDVPRSSRPRPSTSPAEAPDAVADATDEGPRAR
jgi:hypothetical protein